MNAHTPFEVTARIPGGYCTTIDAWRGRCLNLFSAVEQEVTRTLIVARENGREVAIPQTPGLRIQNVAKLVAAEKFTSNQRKQMEATLLAWHAFDDERNFLAHGTRQCLTDQTGSWHVRFDIELHDKCAMPPQRIFSSQEAADLEQEVNGASVRLRTQLRQFQSRMSMKEAAVRATTTETA
ncbi:hypothetical protein [Croceicoccus mobilis]|uniref:Uncharacterized protein n=1 Tax=Croceicoccus mobilis TaxID=1703339 RepID=A0A917DQM6_9SPHN|nr:hypothetical protein [Croceicoccus mobilis]GGD60394.1 hypothetical protein GCM10010990_07290 [Croceicoccus mobilis]